MPVYQTDGKKIHVFPNKLDLNDNIKSAAIEEYKKSQDTYLIELLIHDLTLRDAQEKSKNLVYLPQLIDHKINTPTYEKRFNKIKECIKACSSYEECVNAIKANEALHKDILIPQENFENKFLESINGQIDCYFLPCIDSNNMSNHFGIKPRGFGKEPFYYALPRSFFDKGKPERNMLIDKILGDDVIQILNDTEDQQFVNLLNNHYQSVSNDVITKLFEGKTDKEKETIGLIIAKLRVCESNDNRKNSLFYELHPEEINVAALKKYPELENQSDEQMRQIIDVRFHDHTPEARVAKYNDMKKHVTSQKKLAIANDLKFYEKNPTKKDKRFYELYPEKIDMEVMIQYPDVANHSDEKIKQIIDVRFPDYTQEGRVAKYNEMKEHPIFPGF